MASLSSLAERLHVQRFRQQLALDLAGGHDKAVAIARLPLFEVAVAGRAAVFPRIRRKSNLPRLKEAA